MKCDIKHNRIDRPLSITGKHGFTNLLNPARTSPKTPTDVPVRRLLGLSYLYLGINGKL